MSSRLFPLQASGLAPVLGSVLARALAFAVVAGAASLSSAQPSEGDAGHAHHLHHQAASAPAALGPLTVGQIDTVRRAVARYRDYRTARREGWRPFGGEEPLMGRHYNNKAAPDYVAGQPLDFSRPNVLMYAEIDGGLTLTGVAFVVRIAADEAPPEGFAGTADKWHVHDMVDAIEAATEERPVLRGLARRWLRETYYAKGDARTRLAMVHVWTEAPNPDGPFADYDRTLPFRKLGLPAAWAEGVSHDAARGVHLASAEGCADAIDGKAWIADLSRRQKRTLRRACKALAERVRAALSEGRAAVGRAGAAAWADYRRVYERVLDADQKRRVAAMTEHHHGPGRSGAEAPSR